MDRQAVFNIVVQHLRKQGARSAYSDTGKCLYRGPAGMKCAVGVLIKDEVWEKMGEHNLNGATIYAFAVREMLEESGWKLSSEPDANGWDDVDFLRKLQQIHDGDPVETWEQSLRDLGAAFGLTMPGRE